MATLLNVAERAGVSVTTISRMLNNRVNVSEKTRKKIYAAMKELNYYPNEIARSLTKKKSNIIGLIVPSAKNFFYSQIIEYTEYYAEKKGYKLLLCISNHDSEKESRYFGMLKANKVTGIIIASRTQNLSDYITMDSPLISIDRIISPGIPSISSDNYKGGILAATEFITKGCKNLAYISGSADLDFEANKRFLGFRDTCLSHGLTFPVFLDATEERFFSMDYREIVAELFQKHPYVEGIFTSNDIIAAQTIQYCNKHHISIPGQVKLIGYDDTDVAALCSPSLSTIHQPIEEICQQAVEGIFMASAKGILPRSQLLPVTFVERETT